MSSENNAERQSSRESLKKKKKRGRRLKTKKVGNPQRRRHYSRDVYFAPTRKVQRSSDIYRYIYIDIKHTIADTRSSDNRYCRRAFYLFVVVFYVFH